jgi:hypothetical protein
MPQCGHVEMLLSDVAMLQIEECLKEVLEIP